MAATKSHTNKWPLLERICPRWPRHSVNLITLILGTVILFVVWQCSNLMTMLIAGNLVCGVIFHGAHCLGHQPWADAVFMKFDFLSILLSTIGAFCTTTSEAAGPFMLVMFATLCIWLLSFGPLKGIPLNPIQSVLHVLGVFSHWLAAAPVCTAASGLKVYTWSEFHQ